MAGSPRQRRPVGWLPRQGRPTLAQLLAESDSRPAPGVRRQGQRLQVREPGTHGQLIVRLRMLRRRGKRKSKATHSDSDGDWPEGAWRQVNGKWRRKVPTPCTLAQKLRGTVQQGDAVVRRETMSARRETAARVDKTRTWRDLRPQAVLRGNNSGGDDGSDSDSTASFGSAPRASPKAAEASAVSSPARAAARRRGKQEDAPRQCSPRRARPVCTERTYRELLRAFEEIDRDCSGSLEWSELSEWVRNGRVGRKAALRFVQQQEQGRTGALDWAGILRFFFPQATDAQIELSIQRWGPPAGAVPKAQEHWTAKLPPDCMAELLELFAALADARAGADPPVRPDWHSADLQTPEAREAIAGATEQLYAGVSLGCFARLAGALPPQTEPPPVTRRLSRRPSVRLPAARSAGSDEPWNVWPPTPRALQTLFRTLDGDGDGVLSLQELLPLVTLCRVPLRELQGHYDAPAAATRADRSLLLRPDKSGVPGAPPTGGDNIWLSHAQRWLYDDKHPPPQQFIV